MNTAKDLTIVLRAHLPAILLLIFAGVPSRLAAADDLTGEWEVKMDRNGRESFASLSITKKADGTFAGKWGGTDLSDVKLDGQKLTFVRTVKFGDQEFKMSYEGSFKDGSITGTISSDRGSFAANAARRKARNPVLGRWELKYKVGDLDINATLAVSEAAGGSLEGKWTSNIGEHVVTEIKFQDGKLKLSRKSKIQEREIATTFEGALEGNKLTGTIKSDLGEIPVNGQRVGADLVGKWELSTSTDRGPRTSLLTVFGDLTGRYEIFGAEIPFKDLKLEGSEVAFTVETGFGDQPFKIDFKGKLDGKTLKGETTSSRGTRAVTGKKVEPAAAVAGTWEITRESQRGPRTVRLTIKEDLTATYTYGDSSTTVGVTDLRLEGDQLSFKVTVKYGDRDVPTTFKRKVDGATLKGQFTTERGSREATGKKVVTPTTL